MISNLRDVSVYEKTVNPFFVVVVYVQIVFNCNFMFGFAFPSRTRTDCLLRSDDVVKSFECFDVRF